jgi:hypothetical protein
VKSGQKSDRRSKLAQITLGYLELPDSRLVMNVLKSLNYALHAGVLLLALAACSVASERARAQLISDALIWSQLLPE